MTQEQMTVDGVEVFIEGEGPKTIVMIHGWPDTHRLWDAQVTFLKDRFRCVRFTLPGFDVAGPSRHPTVPEMAALFKRIVDAVSPGEPVTLLLHDWGAVYGYQFAALHPDRVARVIGVDIGDTGSRAFLKSLSFKATFMVVAYQVWLAMAWMIRGPIGDRMTRAMARALRCKSDPALMGWKMNYPYYDTWTGRFNKAPQFKPHCPVLYLYGERKPLQFHSPRWLETLRATPGSVVQGFATGHWVMVQQPEAFNRAVGEWLSAA